MKERWEPFQGIVDVTRKGVGYVAHDEMEDDVEIAPEDLNTALNGDEVEVEIISLGRPAKGKDRASRAQRTRGRVLRIVKRASEEFVGTLTVSDSGAYVLKSDDPRMYAKIRIARDAAHTGVEGDKVVAKITRWTDAKVDPVGEVVRTLGRAGVHETEMQAALAVHGFVPEFPTDVMREAAELEHNREIPDEEIRARRDFRTTPTFTIDPKDAKDFDDAISVKPLQGGDFEIGIHIADVTHYVRPGAAIDREAEKRGTSVYLVDRTIPMLPEVLSNDLCSLKPDVDRLAFSAVFVMNHNAHIKERWFGRAVIHSAKRFTYEAAQNVLTSGAGEFHDELKTLEKLGHKLRHKRTQQGALSFDTPEVRFELAPDLPAPRPDIYFVYAIFCADQSFYIGQTSNLQKRWEEHLSGIASEHTKKYKPLAVIHFEEYGSRAEAVKREQYLKTGFGRKWLKREYEAGRTRQAGGTPLRAFVKERLETMRIVEDFMLLANQEVATWIEKLSKEKKTQPAFIYRVHDTPNPDRIEELRIFLRAVGYDLGGKHGEVASRDINQLLTDIKDKPEEMMVQMAMLRSMAKAVYTHKNIGHFSLSFRNYTHFTSPIRRFPDMIAHRLLAHHLAGQPVSHEEIVRYQRAAVTSSEREVAAVEAERDSTKYKQVEYMSKRIGQTFTGTVTGVIEHGMFVAEDETKAEGFVHISTLGDDYYDLNEKSYSLVGRKSKKKFRLGDPVRIKLLTADLELRQLNWGLV